MEHARQNLVSGQFGNIEHLQDFRLIAGTANTPVRRIWHSLGVCRKRGANAKSKSRNGKKTSLVPLFDLKFLTERAARE
jgi:hypothetical protein